jgi:hypothetical protein
MTELPIAAGLIGGVVVAHELGFRLGSLVRSADDPFDQHLALIRTSTAALVAILIGFAFSGAASRFVDRLDIILREANALGTAYLRADTIAEPQRSELKAALREYTADRVQLLSGAGRDRIEFLLAKVGGLHERMWKLAVKGTEGDPELMLVVLPPINQVIDLHSTHLAMARRHLPLPIMAVLLGTVAISFCLVGFVGGRVGRRFTLLDSVYAVVLTVALWVTIDLDYPGMGTIRVISHPIVESLAAMK